MSEHFNNKVILKDRELDVIVSTLDMVMKSFEKIMDERGHNNMSIQDQFSYVEVKNLHTKLKEQYY